MDQLGFLTSTEQIVKLVRDLSGDMGVDGILVQHPMPAQVDERAVFETDVIDELGSRQEIEYIHTILRNGTGADRQLKVFSQTNDLKKVVDYMVEETRAGVFEEAVLTKN